MYANAWWYSITSDMITEKQFHSHTTFPFLLLFSLLWREPVFFSFYIFPIKNHITKNCTKEITYKQLFLSRESINVAINKLFYWLTMITHLNRKQDFSYVQTTFFCFFQTKKNVNTLIYIWFIFHIIISCQSQKQDTEDKFLKFWNHHKLFKAIKCRYK